VVSLDERGFGEGFVPILSSFIRRLILPDHVVQQRLAIVEAKAMIVKHVTDMNNSVHTPCFKSLNAEVKVTLQFIR
jgi:hypothetical protein